MGQRAGKVTAEELIAVALPAATKTYTVISHEFLIETTRARLEAKGFEVKNEGYKSSASGEVATAQYRIEYGNDPDLGMLFSWANSYDKSMRFKCAVGGFVRASGASVISDTINNWKRKHTGDADTLTLETIQKQIDAAEVYFKQLCEDKDNMKAITMSKREMSEMLGILYFELGVISTEQLGIIKREYTKPRFTYTTPEDSLWTMYNHILVALAKSNPKQWMDQQRIVHMFVLDHAGISTFMPADVSEESESPAESTEGEEEPTQDPIEATQEQEESTISQEAKDYHNHPEAPIVNLDAEEDSEHEAAGMVELERPNPLTDHEKEVMFDVDITRMTVDEIMEKYGDTLTEDQVNALNAHQEQVQAEAVEYKAEVAESITEQAKLDEITEEDHMNAVDPEDEEVVEDQQGHGDVIETKTVSAPIMMAKTDVESAFPGQGAGDIIEIDEAYFELTEVEGDDDCFALAAIEVEEAEEVEDKIDPEAEVSTGLGLPKQATQEDVDAKAEESSTTTEEPIMTGCEEPLDAKVMMDHTEIEIIPPAKDEVDLDESPVRQKIQAELLDIYGEIREFEYEKKGDQYNITLGTNETMVMLATEVEEV